MASSTSAVLLVLVVVVQSGLSCRYFCRNPVTGQYDCCDDGNPYHNTNTDNPNTGNPNTASNDDGSNTESNGSAPVTVTVKTDYGIEDGAKYNETSNCRYYCAYGSNVYCCDDGSLTMPSDHKTNTGRCPTLTEQVCKADAVYLALKAAKTGKTKTGTSTLSKIGSGTIMCASDGYCGDDEKCCPSICHKRHVCLKTLHNDKTKN